MPSKQKKQVIIIVALVAVVVLSLVLVLTLFNNEPTENDGLHPSSATSINKPSENGSSIVINIQKVESTLDSVLVVLDEGTTNEPTFLSIIDNKNDYEILAVEETESGIIAIIKVVSPDLYNIAKKLDSDGAVRTEEELFVAISNEVANADLIETQIEMEFILTEDGLSPVITSTFLDALYGGVFRLYDDILNSK